MPRRVGADKAELDFAVSEISLHFNCIDHAIATCSRGGTWLWWLWMAQAWGRLVVRFRRVSSRSIGPHPSGPGRQNRQQNRRVEIIISNRPRP